MRQSQRGSAMLVTLILIAALLAGAAVLASMQLSSTRSSEVTRTGTTSMYCAEAGVVAARSIVAANYLNWTGNLGTGTEPTWLSTALGTHDIDGDGSADFMVYLKDNDDEVGVQNPLVDNDLRIFIVSRCTKYTENMKEVEELVQYSGGGTCYQSQQGGCGGNGNSN